MLPTDASLQSFQKRYTNDDIESDKVRDDERHNPSLIEENNIEDNEYDLPPSLLSSSWLSPTVKNEMKRLMLDAVRTALDDDVNILDPLIGRFVTRSNRLEDNFGGIDDESVFSSFLYPKPLHNIIDEERKENKASDNDEWESELEIWANATNTLREVFKLSGPTRNDACLRRAEGIAFAWSSVYDKERHVRKYRLYAQGRPPFEVVVVEEPQSTPLLSPPDSAVARLMDRISNGPALNSAFVVDELDIHINEAEKGTKYTVTWLLYELVEEGLLYGEYNSHLGSVRRGQC